MLQRLTHALGLTVGQLFARDANPDDIVMRAATRVAFDTSAFRFDDAETGQPVNVGNVCRDISQRKRSETEARESDRRYREMQMELAHANRVATMRQLTTSIAHEVNQPIAAMITNAEAALRWLRAGSSHLDKVQHTLPNIVEDGHRAAEVIDRIR